MRRLIVIVLAAALLWSGWWVLGARATKAGFEGWLAAQREAGRVARAEIRVRGFPSRFDTTFTGLELGDPEAVLWSADRFQTLMLSYAPNRAVAAWPGPQRIATPAGAVVIEGAEASASVRVGVAPSLPLERLAFVGREVTAAGEGWRAAAAEVRAAAEREDGGDVPPEEATYHLGVLVRDVDLMPGDLPPGRLSLLRIDAHARLSAPLDRAADPPPRLLALDLEEARLDWGAARLRLSGGPIGVGPDGALDGTLAVRLDEWPRLVEAAVAAGLLPARQAPVTIAALDLIAGEGAARGVIETELTFSGGRMRLGPIPLGAAPRLYRQ